MGKEINIIKEVNDLFNPIVEAMEKHQEDQDAFFIARLMEQHEKLQELANYCKEIKSQNLLCEVMNALISCTLDNRNYSAFYKLRQSIHSYMSKIREAENKDEELRTTVIYIPIIHDFANAYRAIAN